MARQWMRRMVCPRMAYAEREMYRSLTRIPHEHLREHLEWIWICTTTAQRLIDPTLALAHTLSLRSL